MSDKVSDDSILDYIFNPGLSGRPEPKTSVSVDWKATASSQVWASVTAALGTAIRLTESEKKYEQAMEVLATAIEALPSYPALYANRAQVLLLQCASLSVQSSTSSSNDNDNDNDNNNDGLKQELLARAMKDLEKAIALAKGDEKVLGNAYTQKGLVHSKLEEKEEALECFQYGEKYGNLFAKQQVIELNPYAALCNQMLTQAMQEQVCCVYVYKYVVYMQLVVTITCLQIQMPVSRAQEQKAAAEIPDLDALFTGKNSSK
jgi:tetratricopeptide (TPR) repeat protein